MNRFLEHGKSDGFFFAVFPHGEEPMPMLNALGAPRVEYLGNLKYYADRLRVDDAKKQSLRGYLKEDRVWDAVSIHAPNFLLQVHSHLKKETNAKSFILAVRHLYRMEDIKTLCKKYGLTVGLFSAEHWDADVILMDEMGCLRTCFSVIVAAMQEQEAIVILPPDIQKFIEKITFLWTTGKEKTFYGDNVEKFMKQKSY